MENITMLKYTNVLATDTNEIPCGFAHRKDDEDNLYYALFFADENNNLMWLDLELWSEFYGGIQHGKVYPAVGEMVSQDYEQVQDPEDYLAALQDVGIIGPDVWIDSYIEPFEVSRY